MERRYQATQVEEQLTEQSDYWRRRLDARMARIEAMFEQLMKSNENESIQDQLPSVIAPRDGVLDVQSAVVSKMDERIIGSKEKRLLTDPPHSLNQIKVGLLEPQSCDPQFDGSGVDTEEMLQWQSDIHEVPIVDSCVTREGAMDKSIKGAVITPTQFSELDLPVFDEYEQMLDLPVFDEFVQLLDLPVFDDYEQIDGYTSQIDKFSKNHEVLIGSFATREGFMSDIDAESVMNFVAIHRPEPNEMIISQFEKPSKCQCSMTSLPTEQLMLTNSQELLEMSEGNVLGNWQQDECRKITQSENNDALGLYHWFSPKWYHRHKYKDKGVDFMNDSEGLSKEKENEVNEKYEGVCKEVVKDEIVISSLANNNFKRIQMEFQGQDSNLPVLAVVENHRSFVSFLVLEMVKDVGHMLIELEKGYTECKKENNVMKLQRKVETNDVKLYSGLIEWEEEDNSGMKVAPSKREGHNGQLEEFEACCGNELVAKVKRTIKNYELNINKGGHLSVLIEFSNCNSVCTRKVAGERND